MSGFDIPCLGMVLRDRYRLVAEIGVGRSARVFRAHDLVAGRAGLAMPALAVKLVDGGAGDIALLLHREGRRLRSMAHPNIVRVFDVDTAGSLHFMVMEEIAGPTLAKAMRDAAPGGLGPLQVERIVADIAAALDYVHGQGFVHGDVKPANVILRRGGPATLVDFNIASRILPVQTHGDLEGTAAILGRNDVFTPAYASPQRLAGGEPAIEDDVFALAVMALRAMTGVDPFGGETALDVKRRGGVAAIPDTLCRRHRRVLARALRFDDHRRSASAMQFARALSGTAWPLGRHPAWPEQSSRATV